MRSPEDWNDKKVRQIRSWVLGKAAKARTNVVDFFNFVMKEETKRATIQAAPHQKLFFEFVMKHDRSVVMMPIGHSKTFNCAALTLFFLGLDPTRRGMILSASEDQSAKVLGMVRDYIETSDELHLVFPDLKRSTRQGDPWTQVKFTVDRPPGIRDASLMAIGLDSKKVSGARLNWIIIDDVLTLDNTRTPEQRQQVLEFVDAVVLRRLDPVGSKVVVINTALHPDDLPHKLTKQGWPTLKMQVLGDIWIRDDMQTYQMSQSYDIDFEPFDSDLVRGCEDPIKLSHLDAKSFDSVNDGSWVRLVANDDPKTGLPAKGRETLWPERIPLFAKPPNLSVTSERMRMLPQTFAQVYMQECTDDMSSMCKRSYIETCKQLARNRAVYAMLPRWEGGLVFTGVDLAIKKGAEHDETAFFTFAVNDGFRQILDIEIGQFDPAEVLERLEEKHRAFNSIICIEEQAGGDMIKFFALRKNLTMPVKTMATTAAKHAQYGVASIFIEMQNGAWLIPNDQFGHEHPMVRQFTEACLNYTPSEHTADILMASYMARQIAREWGVLTGGDVVDGAGLDVMER